MVTLRASRHTPRRPTHAPPHTNPLMIPDVSFDVCECVRLTFRLCTLPFVESVPRLAPSLLRKAIAFSMLLRRAEAESGFLSTKGISEFAIKREEYYQELLLSNVNNYY